MKECPICREVFSLSLRKEISCSHCLFSCCRFCFRKYLLQSTIEPNCMNCKIAFSYEFLIKSLPSTFWNGEYKEYRKNLLLAREESHLPETQEILIKMMKQSNLYQLEKKIRQKIKVLNHEYRRLGLIWEQMSRVIEDERHGRRPIRTDLPLFECFDENYMPLTDERDFFLYNNDEQERGERNKKSTGSSWVMSCPKEDCKGFLNDKQDKCPLCLTEICITCSKLKENLHECKEEDIKTLQLLKQNTKSCPSCHTSIYKVSGCDQMWCTYCNTPFSWKTGERINTVIHNPHYFEYLQRRGSSLTTQQLPLEMNCDDLPSIARVQQKLDQILDKKFGQLFNDWIFPFYRYIRHIENVDLPKYQNTVGQSCVELRVSYLQHYLTKDQWKSELYKREKQEKKHTQYIQILETYVQVGKDCLRNFVENEPEKETLKEMFIEFCDFSSYLNEQIRNLNLQYKSHLPTFPIHRLPEI